MDKIDLNLFNDVHNPKKIILFRHFVCYLLKIAYLQTQKLFVCNGLKTENFDKLFRSKLEALFKSIGAWYDSNTK